MSSVLCIIVVLLFMIETLRGVVFYTILDEDFQLMHQQKANYPEVIHANLYEHLIDVTRAYQIPDFIVNDLVLLSEVKETIETQTIKVLQYIRGEINEIPDIIVDEYMNRFRSRLNDYEIDDLSGQNITLSLNKNQLYEDIEMTLDKYLSLVDRSVYFTRTDLRWIGKLAQVFLYEHFGFIIGVLSVGSICGYLYIWRKNILEIIYYVSISIVIAGGIMFISLLFVPDLAYTVKSGSFESSKQFMYEVMFNDMFHKLSNYSGILVTCGLLVCISVIGFKQYQEMKFNNV